MYAWLKKATRPPNTMSKQCFAINILQISIQITFVIRYIVQIFFFKYGILTKIKWIPKGFVV